MKAVSPRSSWDRVRAVIETARLSNAPTVATNALTGAALGAAAGPVWGPAAGAAAALVLLYAGGMLLNGGLDAAADRAARPERAIPQGRLSAEAAIRLAFVAVGLGLAALAPWGPAALGWGLALAACVLGYDLLHARPAAAVIGMALCRGLTIPTAAAAAGAWAEPNVAAIAALLGVGTAAITAVARGETAERPGAVRFAALAWPALPFGAWLALPLPAAPAGWAALAAVGGWNGLAAGLAVRGEIGRAVPAAIAGLALLDAWILTLLDRPAAGGIAGLGFLATVLAQRRVAGA